MVESALGGVLIVDEAYAIVSDERDQFGKEALDTLIKLTEDHRDDLVVILAGYHREMRRLLALPLIHLVVWHELREGPILLDADQRARPLRPENGRLAQSLGRNGIAERLHHSCCGR